MTDLVGSQKHAMGIPDIYRRYVVLKWGWKILTTVAVDWTNLSCSYKKPDYLWMKRDITSNIPSPQCVHTTPQSATTLTPTAFPEDAKLNECYQGKTQENAESSIGSLPKYAIFLYLVALEFCSIVNTWIYFTISNHFCMWIVCVSNNSTPFKLDHWIEFRRSDTSEMTSETLEKWTQADSPIMTIEITMIPISLLYPTTSSQTNWSHTYIYVTFESKQTEGSVCRK